MSGPEKKFSNYLVAKLRDNGWWVQPIESSETGVGIPDLYLCKRGTSLWMELKTLPDAVWPTDMRLPFRPGQYGWLHTHAVHGGLSIVAVRVLNGFVFSCLRDIDTTTLAIRKERKSVLFMSRFNSSTLDAWLEVGVPADLYDPPLRT